MRRLPRSTAADRRGGGWCPGVLPRLLALLAAATATPWPQDASQVVHDRYDIIFCHPPAGRSLNDRSRSSSRRSRRINGATRARRTGRNLS